MSEQEELAIIDLAETDAHNGLLPRFTGIPLYTNAYNLQRDEIRFEEEDAYAAAMLEAEECRQLLEREF